MSDKNTTSPSISDVDVSPADLEGPKVDRRTAVKVFGAAGMGALAGCSGGGGGDGSGDDGSDDDGSDDDGSGDDGSGDDGSDRYGGRLKAAWWTGDISNLDPAYISTGIYFQLSVNIFNGLVMANENLEIVPDLATDWTVEDDGTRMVFDLRDDVSFHNGDHFTAEDVKYTIERNIEREAPHNLENELIAVEDGAVEVVDDYTVALNWEAPLASALALLTAGPGRAATIVNRTAFEEMGAEEYNLEPVGTGPFQVESHDTGSEIILDGFDDYFREDEDGNSLPYLDGVDVSLIPEPGTVVNTLQSGDIQFTNLLPLGNINEVEDSPDAGVSSTIGNTWAGVIFNHAREPFDAVETRLGIAKAIDNEAFVESAYFNYGVANPGVFSPSPEWIWREPDEKPDDQAYAPEEAQELLEEGGAMDTTISILANPENLRASRVLNQQLNAVGLDSEVDQVTSATFWERFDFDGDFDILLSGSVDKPDPEESIWNFFRLPDEDGVWNWAQYRNQEVHDLLGEQRRQIDQEERRETLWEIEDILIREAASGFIGHQEDVCGIRDEVKGFVHIPAFVRKFEPVWLDE
ncbi:ABC transporter substrate-binding protein [Halorubrum sp. 48-1-W]|uniref:ABC transporter substrate-binding protein n=1 Tax=Halorubrum sp. 48-1-W TaxID=2249761 RepID=UPI000DCDE030|nr:ABC transporter substrate-binding protein [Halorubrum sp. 48-1-W]RAW46117.1 ABC transporter substrate-binding protein [Halorubrum sp. 48-1-W]